MEGGMGTNPINPLDCFKPWLESEGAIVEVYDSLDPYADPEYMKGIDLVIQILPWRKLPGSRKLDFWLL